MPQLTDGSDSRNWNQTFVPGGRPVGHESRRDTSRSAADAPRANARVSSEAPPHAEEGLAVLGMGPACDDIGTGRARMAEMLAVPPDYAKFDISIIRGIDELDEAGRGRVASLVGLLKGQGVLCLAEGVEHAAEAEACRAVGFDLARGWHYGRPAPVRDQPEAAAQPPST